MPIEGQGNHGFFEETISVFVNLLSIKKGDLHDLHPSAVRMLSYLRLVKGNFLFRA